MKVLLLSYKRKMVIIKINFELLFSRLQKENAFSSN